MPEWLLGAIVGIVSTVIGAITNHLLTIRRDRKKEQREAEQRLAEQIRFDLTKPGPPASKASDYSTYDTDAGLKS